MNLRFVCAALLLAAGVGTPGGAPDPPVDYARDVRPILSRNCFPCHGHDEDSRQEDLRLDIPDGATADRGGYQAIVPGRSAESEAYLRITDDIDPMPPEDSGRALSPEEIELIRRWIDEGAKYSTHWAFVPPQRPLPPEVREAAWPRNAIDRFVLARLEEAGLAPSPAADRYTLARRSSLDLTGLPPTLQEVQAFVADAREDAYERFVDGLLASPAYGERWASVWLDLARYADSSGHGSDPLRVIWRYRDWVIDAFNSNKPFDEFTVEQLAGDLLPDAELEQRLATAFHRNTMTNTEGGTDDEEFRVAAVKDRAITTGQVWLGLTVGCAQCHSHKFDPLSHREFYRFYAFFNQTADTDKNDDSPRLETPSPGQVQALGELRAEIAELEVELEDPARDVSDALAEWERGQREWAGHWRVLEATGLASEGGSQLTQRDDGSILASGVSPEKDVYTIVAESPLEEISAVRLEILPHDSLARGGPGRAPGNGNVILGDFRLRAEPREGTAPAQPNARYVRVTNLGESSILSLAEIEVLSAGENVAREGTATQSSTAYDGPARLAIDGDTNGHFFEGRSITHSATEKDPWWELDLGRTVPVDRIRLWNRTDGGLEHRLSNFVVGVLDAERRTVWSTWVQLPPQPDLELDLSSGAGTVRFAAASADFSDPDWAVELAIDDRLDGPTGWGLNPSLGGSHVAVFETASELSGTKLGFTLRQEFGAHHTIGRFRLSVTDQPRPVRALPRDVAAALETPVAERSDEQIAALRRHYQTIDPELKNIRDRIAELEQQVSELGVVTTPVMVELAPQMRRATHVMLKGNFLDPGEKVEPRVPSALHPWQEGEPLDRLGLARWITHPDNPLTARVTVNRWWSRIFGRGLVETEEDFGTQGSEPTHPDLLDWLALGYVESGWDTKALLKTIVTSATYRQASDVRAAHLERDPANELYARAPRYRMDAEMVRDVLLAVAGLLSRETHGPSVYPPQPDGLWQAAFNGERTWPESSGEERYRRGLYVFLRRTIPYPSLATFDAPSGEICTVRRTRTNTPLQAFVTLNDPVYVEAAQALARRIVREGGSSPRSRVAHGLFLSTQRPPDEARISVLEELYTGELEHYRTDAAAALALATEPLGPLEEGQSAAELAAWTVVANVMLNQDAVLVRD